MFASHSRSVHGITLRYIQQATIDSYATNIHPSAAFVYLLYIIVSTACGIMQYTAAAVPVTSPVFIVFLHVDCYVVLDGGHDAAFEELNKKWIANPGTPSSGFQTVLPRRLVQVRRVVSGAQDRSSDCINYPLC